MSTIVDEETKDGRYVGPSKLVVSRDYSGGSIRDRIQRCETVEELEALRRHVVQLLREGRIPRRTARKIDAAGKAKAQELSMRLVTRVPAKILVPGGARSRGGIIIP